MALNLTGNDPYFTDLTTVAAGGLALQILLPVTCNKVVIQPLDDFCYVSYVGTDAVALTDYHYQPHNSMVEWEVAPNPHGNRNFFIQVPNNGDTVTISLLQG